jgi:WD domain, G-beta repeat.
MDLSEDNYHIASGAEDGTVIVYNLFEDKQVFTFEVQDAKVWCVKISSKNSFLASGDDKAQIHL